MTKVSVVVPAYNAERYIGDALVSIQEQTLHEVEVVVVDDGSTDDTVAVVKGFADSLNLTLVCQMNAGPAAARNAGIRKARGRHCAFLDADDVMLPQRLAMQCELLDAEPDLGLVHTDLMTFDDGGIIHRTRRAFSEPGGGHVLDRLLLDNFITTSTVMAPTQRLIDAGLFDEARRVSEDFALWLRMAARWKVGYIERPLVKYRRRHGSLSDDKLATARCALEVIEAFWDEHPDYLKSHRRTYSRSLAMHLSTAGAAAIARNQRRTALSYLLGSLVRDPWKRATWKSLAKTLIMPAWRSQRACASRTEETA